MTDMSSSVRLIFCLSGFRKDVLYAEFTRFSSLPRFKKHTEINSTLGNPQTQEGYVYSTQPHRYLPPKANELRLAIVGDMEEIGEWGLTRPVLLEELPLCDDDKETDEKNRHKDKINMDMSSLLSFTATVHVPESTIMKTSLLRFRLVIVDEPLLSAAFMSSNEDNNFVCIVPASAAIVAVENARWHPDVTSIVMDTVDKKIWRADIDVRERVLHFARASEQFPFLSQLSKNSTGSNGVNSGPLLSLSIYANDPRERYERQTWLDSLPPKSRDAVMFLQQEKNSTANDNHDSSMDSLLPTSYIELEDIYPVFSDGCCWCEGHLPTPAPMEKQRNIVKESTSRIKKTKKKMLEKGKDVSTQQQDMDMKDSKNIREGSMSSVDYSSWKHQGIKGQMSFSSENTSFDNNNNNNPVTTAMMRRGWCVEAMHSIDPIRPFSTDDSQYTMRVWHSTVNVAPLKGCGLQIDAMIPLPIYDINGNDSMISNGATSRQFVDSFTMEKTTEGSLGDSTSNITSNSNSNGDRVVVGIRWVKGTAVLQPPLFKQHTNGTLVVPICFTDTSSNVSSSPVTHWHTLYVQYLFVFPFHHPQRNTLEVVRSLTSLGRLATKKPVGHRGLGKTYTRSAVSETSDDMSSKSLTSSFSKSNRLTVKLAENSLESINAAHRRGCDMVEFDVMLTRDRVPVIFHDPLIQLQARKKKGAGTRNGRVEDQLLSKHTFPSTTDVVASSNDTQSWLLSPVDMYGPPNFASVPIAVHQLTKRQLDVVTTETFNHVKDTNILRKLILRHWNQILHFSSNRRHSKDIQMLHVKSSKEGNNSDKCLLEEGKTKNMENFEYDKKNIYNRRRLLDQEEDVTNRICTLKDLFEGTPATLRFDLEVKFPFQPIGDNNLYLQSDAFEVNAFVDDILRVVFTYSDQRQMVKDKYGNLIEQPRDVIFSSFEPDICLALKMKQSRFDVVFLCDTDMYEDFKDYRCFGLIEGALQFSIFMHLSGISILAASLCIKEQRQFPSSVSLPRLRKQPESLQQTVENISNLNEESVTSVYTNNNNNNTTMTTNMESKNDEEYAQREAMWASFDYSRGKAIAAYAHAHQQLVWTWGEKNCDEQFTYVQTQLMMIDAIITDNVPLWSSAQVTDSQGSTLHSLT